MQQTPLTNQMPTLGGYGEEVLINSTTNLPKKCGYFLTALFLSSENPLNFLKSFWEYAKIFLFLGAYLCQNSRLINI